MLDENPITIIGRLWPNAKQKKLPQNKAKNFNGDQTGNEQQNCSAARTGRHFKKESIPNIKAEGRVLTPLTLFRTSP